MGKPGDRFNTVRSETGTPIHHIKVGLTELEKMLSVWFDPGQPRVVTALQHFERGLHSLAQAPGAHERHPAATPEPAISEPDRPENTEETS
jgi:hypothetical protein